MNESELAAMNHAENIALAGIDKMLGYLRDGYDLIDADAHIVPGEAHIEFTFSSWRDTKPIKVNVYAITDLSHPRLQPKETQE